MHRLALFLASWSIATAVSAAPPDPCADRAVPAAARALGFTRAVIDVCPQATDISPDGQGSFKLYNGVMWDSARAPLDAYRSVPDGLAMKLNGGLATWSPVGAPGELPTLPGDKGFFVEFEAYLSSNERDHWPALWLMPREHNLSQGDVYPGDPKDFQRWMELDVDEGGFTTGWLGTVHSWTGIWPKHQTERSPHWEIGPVLDRRQPHTFSASFEPKTLKVTWWMDGKKMSEAGPPAVPKIARQQNFYLLMNAQTHGKNIPYEMVVRRFRAFVPR